MCVLDDKLTKRFIEGLKKYSITLSDIEDGNFRYSGGDSDRHYRYYRLKYGFNRKLPPHSDSCVCNHKIVENCYISDNDSKTFIVMGNCCIKKFLPKHKQCRTCDICYQPHKNRKVNHCNQCRLNFCYDCDTLLKNKAYKRCYDCHVKKYI